MQLEVQSLLQWAVGGILAILGAGLTLLIRAYDRRISDLEGEDAKIWTVVTEMQKDDRDRWERFEARIDAKFDSLSALIQGLKRS